MGESDKNKNGQRTYGVFCGMRTDELFEAGLENDMQGVFCGHDHYNNFSVNYTPKGADRSIRLTYGMSIDYLAYVSVRDHAQRGCTQILLKADNSFECAPKNYYSDYNVTPENPKGRNNFSLNSRLQKGLPRGKPFSLRCSACRCHKPFVLSGIQQKQKIFISSLTNGTGADL